MLYCGKRTNDSQKQYSHAFGIIYGPGVTVVGCPYYYIMVAVESTQDLEYTIGDTKPKSGNLIQGLQGGSVSGLHQAGL